MKLPVFVLLLLGACAASPSASAPPAAPTPAPAPGPPGGASPGLPCPLFPADHIWNARVDGLPRAANSDTLVNAIGAATAFHPDFGAFLWEGRPVGIPVTVVPASQLARPVVFDVPEESDPGPYPIPPDARVEGGSDRHVLVVQAGTCRLYELYDARREADGGWRASSGAVFDLRSNALRPAGWTSADASGLAILPGLVRFEEVRAGRITHALRFTVRRTRPVYVWPATHWATTFPDDARFPRMGERFRLKATADLSRLGPDARVIARALQEYGMIVTDNGSDWFLSGAPDSRWNDDDLETLKTLRGADFEAVDATVLRVSPGSGAARGP